MTTLKHNFPISLCVGALFGVIGSGGLAILAYGAIADYSSQMLRILASAGTALVIAPLISSLRTVFSSSEGGE